MTDLFDGPPQASFMITRAQRAELGATWLQRKRRSATSSSR